MPFLLEIHALLTTPPGNTIYYLVLAFAILGSYFVVDRTNRGEQSHPAKRTATGLGILLGIQIFHTLAGLAVGAGVLSSFILPVLDRTILALGIVLISWLWAAPKRSAPLDLGAAVLAAFIVLAGIISTAIWLQQPATTFFNAHWLDRGWTIFGMLLLFLGGILLLTRKPSDYGIGATFLAIEFGGYLIHLLAPVLSSNYAGEIRLAQMAAYPLLFALPQRVASPAVVQDEPTAPQKSVYASERKRYNVAPQMLEKFLAITTETDTPKLIDAITHVVAYAIVGDICFWMTPPQNENEVLIVSGYDLIHERKIGGSTIPLKNLPLVKSVFQKNTALRLPASSASADLLHISNALRIEKPGHLMIAPVTLPDGTPAGALALLSIYTKRTWSSSDEQYLTNISAEIGQLLSRNNEKDQAIENVEKFRAAMNDAMAMSDQAERERASTTEAYETLKAELSKAAPQGRVAQLEAEIASLEKQLASATEQGETAMQKDATKIAKKLHAENKTLRSLLQKAEKQNRTLQKDSVAEPADTHAENELQDVLTVNAHLQKMIGETEIKLVELQNLANASERANKNWSSIINIGQELRQPMSSIIGYTDFLLSESVGLLGSLQRKFLERVKRSNERMNAMVENLIQIATVESGQLKLTLGMVNINGVIDAAISATSEFFRSKRITLLVKLPAQLPEIEGDNNALQQTVTQLLRNAGIVTPVEGEIEVEAMVENYENADSYVVIKITDTGGGIAGDDIPNIFERTAETMGMTIDGLGSNSVSLSIAKTLVEAHGGRMWVETALGKTTFQILLPTMQESPEEILNQVEV